MYMQITFDIWAMNCVYAYYYILSPWMWISYVCINICLLLKNKCVTANEIPVYTCISFVLPIIYLWQCAVHSHQMRYYMVSKMSPQTKYDTIAPNLEINEIHFRDIYPDVHADSRCKNSIDRSRKVWVISAWKRRTSFAQCLHFSSLWNVLSDMRFHCFDEIWMWKIWKK